MSHYANLQTNITDIDALVAALCRVENRSGNNWVGRIETHTDAQHLYGYQGDRRPQKAHVIIRRHNVGGAANDLGFVRGKDGKFQAIISEYDSNYYNAAWMGKLTTYYGVEKTKIELDAKGIKYKEGVDASNGNCPTIEAFFEAPKKKQTAATFFDN
jgi:hypothetical protein